MFHGAPGAGKSSLLAQAASGVRGSLYVSAEEELSQVAARALRLGLRPDMELLATDEIGEALAAAGDADLLIVDSIQTMRPDAVAATRAAVAHARDRRVAVALVCHETKSGAHAGLRLLEHLIDCAVRLERDPRWLVVEKNRYGTAGCGLPLKMTERGLSL
jgi:DNA repair protein RadA/Sms